MHNHIRKLHASYLTAILVFGAALLILSCGGSTTTPPPASEGTEVSTSPGAQPPRSEPDEPTAEPDKSAQQLEIEAIIDKVFKGSEPAIDLPSDGAAGLLGASPDYDSSDALAEVVRSAGFDAPGTIVLVLLITGLNESLLVIDTQIEIQAAAGDQEAPLDNTAVLAALLSSPAFKSANVSRLVFQLRAPGETTVLMITVPVSTLESLVDGSITPEEAQMDYRYQILEEATP